MTWAIFIWRKMAIPTGHKARAIALWGLLACFVVHTATAAQPLRIGVSDWPGWVAWYVAQAKGYFRQNGAEVQLVWFPNYSDSIQALAGRRLDANSQTWSDTMPALAAGVKLKVVLVNDNSAGNDALLVSNAIKDWQGLRGQRIALEQFTPSHFLLSHALAAHHLSLDDVSVINMPAPEAAAAFLAGRVQAVAVWNPWVMRIVKSGKGYVLYSSAQMPGLIVDCLVAQGQALEDPERRRQLVGMIRAWYQTVAFIEAHPQEAAAIMAGHVGLDANTYATALQGTHFFDAAANKAAFAADNPHGLLATAPIIAAFLRQHHLLTGHFDAADAIDSSLIQEASP